MTPSQTDLTRVALGLPNKSRRSYRNRFYAGGAPTDWLAMVEAGDAVRFAVGGSIPDYHRYELTRQGAEKALIGKETLCPEDFPPEPAQ